MVKRFDGYRRADGTATTLLVAAERITRGIARASAIAIHRMERGAKGEPRERGSCRAQLGVMKFPWTDGRRESARLCLPDEIYVIIRGRDSCAGMPGN